MFNFLRRHKKKSVQRSIVIPSIGTLYYNEYFWFGIVDTIAPNNNIELTIEPGYGSEPTEEQIKLIQELPGDYHYYMEMLYTHLELAFEKLSLEEIKQMYFLAAIELKKYNREWYFTMEPDFNVPSIYDHFQRFTIVDKMITWSNASLK